MISYIKDEKNKKFIIEFQMNDPHDEREFKDFIWLMAKSENEINLKRFLNVDNAFDALNKIIGYCDKLLDKKGNEYHEIRLKINKIITDSKLDNSLL